MDSILKNVGGQYKLEFGKNLERTFTDAYEAMNDRGRHDMERVLKTWSPVFPVALVQRLQVFVAAHKQPASERSSISRPEVQRILGLLTTLIRHKQQQLYSDPQAQHQIAILQQVRLIPNDESY